eukprot:CAMPEP_0176498350 /NCGR_PEP_ID=MMETSP0200_2-20121128/12269_1 /TAXON_ID=947934 /ORGANISM="Chaetoceros sp., Strain GSL56" /LENGTH=425 /DNA_ID=CAMNT_0017896541 /DNA_START=194 /DNA_END=1471 /DNA_ORIENTATION=-
MLIKAASLISKEKQEQPELFHLEHQLLEKIRDIDLLVIATPNYLHTPQLLRWAMNDLCILVEKPIAISEKQVRALRAASPMFKAQIWTAMEYRFIPAVNKLIQLLPNIGPIKNVTIRENRFPFLSKVGEWNKDVDKSGDTLVEKCCHFFDLFRLITQQEVRNSTAKVHRGLLCEEYGYDKRTDNPTPIIDSAYVLMDFQEHSNRATTTCYNNNRFSGQQGTLGCLELCMFADGSRHQEEIVVTGLKGRVEAYLPENKVFYYQRPKRRSMHSDGTNDDQNGNYIWVDLSQPPPRSSIKEEIIDCSNLSNVYSFANEIPQHAGHHYCSTAVEWKFLIDQVQNWKNGGKFVPQVSLDDGIKAVEMGMQAQMNISNEAETEEHNTNIIPITAFSSQSCEQLLNLAIDMAHMQAKVSSDLGNIVEEAKGQ